MKSCLKGIAPDLLNQYKSNHPNAEWEHFKNECQEGYEKVQIQLRQDQSNLCCYCEIETKQGLGNGKDDFRVEHFHPKSDKSDPNRNWGLEWQNMLGCCHGGQEKYVTDSSNRFIPKHTERHSDVLKQNHIWDGEILNPLEIPPFPIFFHAHRSDGSLSVLQSNCFDSGICTEKANNCLDSEKLNLNSEILKGLRKKAMDALNEQIGVELSHGLSMDQVMIKIVKAQLRKNEDGHWPTFFTTVRSYLGQVAEVYLNSINYSG